MTRDEHREECIDKMRDAFFEMQHMLGYAPQRDHPDPRICIIAAFDALHGVARVVPIEATEEMLDAAIWQRHRDHLAKEFYAMSTAGDLTNPPETKP